jgi:hypothetical protein
MLVFILSSKPEMPEWGPAFYSVLTLGFLISLPLLGRRAARNWFDEQCLRPRADRITYAEYKQRLSGTSLYDQEQYTSDREMGSSVRRLQSMILSIGDGFAPAFARKLAEVPEPAGNPALPLWLCKSCGFNNEHNLAFCGQCLRAKPRCRG